MPAKAKKQPPSPSGPAKPKPKPKPKPSGGGGKKKKSGSGKRDSVKVVVKGSGRRNFGDYGVDKDELLKRHAEAKKALERLESHFQGKRLLPFSELSKDLDVVSDYYARIHSLERRAFERGNREPPESVRVFLNRARALAEAHPAFAAHILEKHVSGSGGLVTADHDRLFLTPSKAVTGAVSAQFGMRAAKTMHDAIQVGVKGFRMEKDALRKLKKRMERGYWEEMDRSKDALRKRVANAKPMDFE